LWWRCACIFNFKTWIFFGRVKTCARRSVCLCKIECSKLRNFDFFLSKHPLKSQMHKHKTQTHVLITCLINLNFVFCWHKLCVFAWQVPVEQTNKHKLF
jgi:hypothetical protein